MEKLSNWIHQWSKGWVVLVSLLIFVLFMIFVLPDQSAKADSYSGDIGSPDTSLFYTAQKLYEFAEDYGAEGRSAYIRARVTFDVAFPVVYTFFLVTTISWVYRKVNLDKTFWLRLNLVPLGGLLLDLTENASTSIVMARFPKTTPVIADLAGIFTVFKWIFVGGSFLILLLGLVLLAWRKIKTEGK